MGPGGQGTAGLVSRSGGHAGGAEVYFSPGRLPHSAGRGQSAGDGAVPPVGSGGPGSGVPRQPVAGGEPQRAASEHYGAEAEPGGRPAVTGRTSGRRVGFAALWLYAAEISQRN